MPAPLTVVIADDSALYRQMLLNVLRRIEGVDVVGVAADGREAVAKARDLRPDVMTLDVHMPVMDGIAVLRALRHHGVPTKAIMVSSLTGAGSPATVEALLEGAFDYVFKPIGLDPHVAREAIRAALAEKLAGCREASARPSVAGQEPAAPGRAAGAPAGRPAAPRRSDLPYDAIAIGTSTGGPETLRAMLPRLPRDLPVPVLVVQHMPPVFTATLAARLNDLSAIGVVEAADGMAVEPGRAYVAPGGKHLRLASRDGLIVCTIDDGPPRLGCRPSFNHLLESMVDLYGDRVVAAVLTGMGSDGLDGCRRLRAAGGLVLAQSHDTCTVYGMPKAVIEAGLARAVLPPAAIADAVATGSFAAT
jgi:two-component system chemotaxis response regulator CheB